ncbi:MAG: prolyl oligopeptidase family serine peptidase [Chloroflexota bacterium]
MRVEQVSLFNAGCRLAGTVLLPDPEVRAAPGIVQGPGWLGLRDAKLYQPYHEALTAAGFVVLTLDYRGFGGSEGDATFLDPMGQVSDIRAGLDYLQTRPEVDPRRLGLFGSGGTGGGNAVMLAGLDARVLATVAQVPVADGRDWLHRMRREHEWLEFLAAVRDARERYASTGEPTLVSPRDGIMVPTPERKTASVKSDVDGRVPTQVALHSADAIMAYRPIEVADRARALMLIAVEGDAVTPEDHAFDLYERATGPRRLLVQTGTTHYAAYAQYRDIVNPRIVEWFERFLVGGEVVVRESAPETGVSYLDRPVGAQGGVA